jgi:hypothetical protein
MPDLAEQSDVDKLEVIMQILPDAADYPKSERREYSLTKGDVLIIFRIAKIAQTPHVCPFEGDEQDTLVSVAKNINRTQKIASVVIITGLVTGMLSGTWFAVKAALIGWIKINGGH